VVCKSTIANGPTLFNTRFDVIDSPERSTHPEVELAIRANYSRPHTFHCGPDAIYVSAMGSSDGGGPGGVFLLDHESFDVLGQWEVDRGPQYFAYDFWWNIGYDVAISSEWGTPDMFENGLSLERLVKGEYGRRLHMWDLRKRRHFQEIDLGAEHQLCFELRPAHDPTKAYGFVCTVISTKDLTAGIWVWHRANGKWAARKVIEIPAEPADPASLPPPLKQFKAVPALVPEIALSLDDRFLYVSCWGTGELRQYDVSDPFEPRLTGTVRLGGIVAHAPHPKAGALNGAPQMLEVSRDGRRVYATNSLYSAVDAQFYPEGINGWMAKIDVNPAGGMSVDPNFFVPFKGERPHQTRLGGRRLLL
jgi:selenium-binding protein 1